MQTIKFTESQILNNLVEDTEISTKTFNYSDDKGNECCIDIYTPDNTISVYCSDPVLYTFCKMYTDSNLKRVVTDINKFFNS